MLGFWNIGGIKVYTGCGLSLRLNRSKGTGFRFSAYFQGPKFKQWEVTE